MSDFQSTTTHTARKPHRCAYCRSTIAAGTAYVKMAGRWHGEFYAGRGHSDCRALWDSLYWDWAGDEGMDWDLAEVFAESGEIGAAKEALNFRRGQFPHAVNRLEFRLRDWLTWDEDEDPEGRFYG